MARLACINTRELALQLLLKRNPQWRSYPTAVVAKDSPLAAILSANRKARDAGVSAGLRYATALAIAPELRAGTVDRWEIDAGVDALAGHLQRFSPGVEVGREERGIFWVDAGGLTRLYPSLNQWAAEVKRALRQQGYFATIAVGFTRFGSYVAAKTAEAPVVFASAEQERRAALEASLEVLPLKPEVQERLHKLGLRTVGSFLRLPAGGVRRRFGPEAERVHHFASGDLSLPLQPMRIEEEREFVKKLPFPVTDAGRVLFHLEQPLQSLLAHADARQELISEIRLTLVLEDAPTSVERVRAASPSLDSGLLFELLALRVNSLQISAGVVEIRLCASRLQAMKVQEELFRKHARRNLDAGARAFDRIRALLGNNAVQWARLRNEHLPQHSFAWETAERPMITCSGRPKTGDRERVQLVRRFFREPRYMRPDAARRTAEAITLSVGPYLISGKWWLNPFDREYYFAETAGGELRWIYYDRQSQEWRIQGLVE